MKWLMSLEFWTFMAVIVALFGKYIQYFFDKPKLEVGFDQASDRCFRNALMQTDNIIEFGIYENVKRQYFRLKIVNTGHSTAKNVKAVVELYNENMEEEERFEPNCLRWITGDKVTDIAEGEVTYVNLLSQILSIGNPPPEIPGHFFVIRLELHNLIHLRGICWDKNSETYNIKIVLHGDNIKSKTCWFRFIPDKDNILNIGKLVEVKQ